MKYIDENFLMSIATLAAFVIGDFADTGVAMLCVLNFIKILRRK